MPTDYSDWIIDLPLSNADDLFPNYSDGCDVPASVALFNSMLLEAVETKYPKACVNQTNRHKYEVYGPENLGDVTEEDIIAELIYLGETLYEDGEWYVLA